MDKKKTRRMVELVKDILIVLLSCSAVWLTTQTPLVRGLLREEGPRALPGQSQGDSRGSGALPMAIVANLPGDAQLPGGSGVPEGSEGVRYGARYDQEACQELFQRIAGPLTEAMTSAGTPERVSREQWERVLTGSLGVYLDFQGQVPLPVLVGWLSGEETTLTATVRRLALVAGEDGTEVYYRDEGDGSFYRCRSRVADPYSLAQALSGLSNNGAFYAFEQSAYEGLDPDTLLLPDAPAPAVYAAANPMSAGQAALESLVQDLGFSLNSTSFYSTDEQVARSGDDNIRLSDRGVVQYLYEGGENSGLFPVLRQGSAGALFDSVETCRWLALAATNVRCGEARLYLLAVRENPDGLEIDFGYSLNGIPVLSDRGCAARFLVREGQVVQFSLELRTYTNSGAASLALPPRQAAAALLARGLEGEELLLTYADNGGDTVTAGWSARDNREG